MEFSVVAAFLDQFFTVIFKTNIVVLVNLQNKFELARLYLDPTIQMHILKFHLLFQNKKKETKKILTLENHSVHLYSVQQLECTTYLSKILHIGIRQWYHHLEKKPQLFRYI